ncbi:MAG TPA: cyclase family protein [Candidatus Deferrimicrobiaceae bacterium]
MAIKPAQTVFDISVPLFAGMAAYPGDPPFALDPVATLDDGPYSLSRLSMSAHAGSHLDFPSPVVRGGRCAADYPPARFLLPAVVVGVAPDAAAVTHEDVLRAALEPGDAVLFRTGGAIALTPEAARACVGCEAGLAGIDASSVDRAGDDELPVHRILLGNDVLVLEGIDLSGVPPGRYSLSCLPLRIAGSEASPVRAVLLGR